MPLSLPTLILMQAEPSRMLTYGALAAVAVLTYLSLRSSQRKLKASRKVDTRAPIEQFRNREPLRNDMEELLVQLQELSRHINAQIDTRFAKLEASIRSADERIARLQRLIADPVRPTALDTVIDDDGETRVAPAPAPATGAPDAGAHDEVYRLADSGATTVDIARATGQTTGEIELILALRSRSG